MSVGGTSGTSGSSSTGQTVDPSTQGFNGLTSQDFLKLLITELQSQDPTQPMDNSQLLNQLSQMRNLQASIDLDSSLNSLTMSQQLNAGASFLGKTVTGSDANHNSVTGVVSSVLLQNNNARSSSATARCR